MRIKVEHVSKRIHQNTVLQDIDFVLRSGKIYGLQGCNGSGKTMLMRLLLGLIHPTSGHIFINEKELGKEIEFPESVGFLIENPCFLDRYSGMDNLKLLADVRGNISEKRIQETLLEVGLEPEIKKKYRHYSLGMKQRLGIAAAIMEEPELIILDEPVNALDASGIALVEKIILRQKERGALVVLSCHDSEFLKRASDKVLQLDQGRITGLWER